MSKSNHSRPKKKQYRESPDDRVDDPIESPKKQLKKRIERSKTRIQEKSVEQNLHKILGENEKQPDHEKVIKKLIQGLVEKKLLTEKRMQEKSVEQNLHEIIGVNEKQPDHEKILNKLIQGVVEKKKEKISENKVNDAILTEHELGKEGYDDFSEDFGIEEDYYDIEIPKKKSKYISIPEKMRESISCYPEETKPFQNYLNFLYFVEKHPNIQKLMQEASRKNPKNFRNFRYSDGVINFIENKIAQKNLNKWIGKPGDSNKMEEMKKTVQLIKKFNSKLNVENSETEPWKLIKWVVEHDSGQITVSEISKMVPLQTQAVNSHLRLMFKEKYNNYILDGAREGNIRHRLVTNVICKSIKNNSKFTGHYVEPGIPFPDYKRRLDHFIDVKYGEKYILIDTTHSMRINSIVKKLVAYPPGNKAELLVVITNPDLTQDYKNILLNQISQFNEKMKNKEGLKRDFIPKTTLKRIKLLNWKEFAHVLGIEENSEEWKELEKICTIDRKGLLEMEKSADYQKVNGNQDFEEFLKSRKISDIFARPDPHIRDNINYLTGLKEHYPIVLNFIQFAQNLYKNDPDSSVNFREINSFLKAYNEIYDYLDPYWSNYDTTKILNGLCENDSISKIGNAYKITESLSNDNNANVNKILLDEKIRDIFKRKNPPTFKEIHGIIDSHVNQYYEFIEKWQPIDSYKILKYYEKNLNGFSIKKKLNKAGSFIVDRHSFVVGKKFPSGDGNVLITVDKDFVYFYPSINLKEGIDQAPVIYDRKTGERIQYYWVLTRVGKSQVVLETQRNVFYAGFKFPKQKGEIVIVRIDKKEKEVKIFPDLGAKEQPVIFKQNTTLSYEKIQKYVQINKFGVYHYAGRRGISSDKEFKLGKEFKNKAMAMNYGNPLTITFYPEHDIYKPGIIFNKNTCRKIQFYQDLEENGGFVFEDKIYSFPEHGGKNVLIKIDEIEKKILCFPECNLEDEPLTRPINESDVVQFFKKFQKYNTFGYLGKAYFPKKDFPSKKVAVTINKSENRIYMYPDQDLSKPPLILDILTGENIQYYRKLQNGYFFLNRVKFDVGEEHKYKLAVFRINDEKNEISVFPDGDLNENPLVFNKTTGKKLM